MLEKINFQRPLVIGTGGGNDIVSACLIVSEFRNKGINADVAGLCSPGADHFYNGSSFENEDYVNLVTSSAKRFIASKNPKQISFLDAELPRLLNQEGIQARVYNLSGKYGTSNLIAGLTDLISEQGYDGVVAVDVGGDILARARKDTTILSPLMDFTTLYCLSQLNIPSVLVEFGLQTDGELRPQGCSEIFAELRTNNNLIDESRINLSDKPVQTFRGIYEHIEKIRRGHTAVMTLKTLESSEDLHEEYKIKVRVLDKKSTHSFPITLESKYFGKVFTIDLKNLARTRELAFPFENSLELFLRTKLIMDTKTEMDLLYNHNSGVNLWLAMTGPQITGEQRVDLLNHGLTNLEKHADAALLWKSDAEDKRIKLCRYSSSLGSFVVTSLNIDNISKVEREVRRVLR
jgi:hypothetical protein